MFNDITCYIDITNFEGYIKKIESMVRTSFEYRTYLSNIYQTHEMIVSPDFTDINVNDEKKFTSEFHHTIFTLYDLVSIVGAEYIFNHTKDKITTFDIAREVVKLHLDDQVTGCVVSKSFHEAVHLGKRKITSDLSGFHIGDYKIFVSKYKDYLTIEEINEYIRLGADKEFFKSLGFKIDEQKEISNS